MSKLKNYPCEVNLLKNKWLRTFFGYGIAALLAYVGFLIYSNDSEAPVLSDFSVSEPTYDATSGQAVINFSGQISDPKGIGSAEIHCIENGESDFFIYIELYGSSKYLVSFGQVSGSFSWLGSWDGSASDLTFKGKGKLPFSAEAATCNWESRLKDSLGNYEVLDLGLSTTIAAQP